MFLVPFEWHEGDTATPATSEKIVQTEEDNQLGNLIENRRKDSEDSEIERESVKLQEKRERSER